MFMIGQENEADVAVSDWNLKWRSKFGGENQDNSYEQSIPN
jgi:hypothetical protein